MWNKFPLCCIYKSSRLQSNGSIINSQLIHIAFQTYWSLNTASTSCSIRWKCNIQVPRIFRARGIASTRKPWYTIYQNGGGHRRVCRILGCFSSGQSFHSVHSSFLCRTYSDSHGLSRLASSPSSSIFVSRKGRGTKALWPPRFFETDSLGYSKPCLLCLRYLYSLHLDTERVEYRVKTRILKSRKRLSNERRTISIAEARGFSR